LFKKYKILLLIIATAFLGAGVGAVSKLSLQEIPEIPFTFLRFLVAALVLIPVFIKQGFRFKLKKFRDLFFVSIFATGNVTFFIFG